DVAKEFGPLSEWEGTPALRIASHLVYNLGAPDQSFRLSMRAWHRDKADPEATLYYAIETFQRRGPLHALIFTRRYAGFHADQKITSWWYSLMGQLHASLRDFSVVTKWHNKAIDACPGESWVWTSRAFTLEQQDRYEEALAAAMKGYELNPLRRASVSA